MNRKVTIMTLVLATTLICGACKKIVIDGDDYCSHCGIRLEWNV